MLADKRRADGAFCPGGAQIWPAPGACGAHFLRGCDVNNLQASGLLTNSLFRDVVRTLMLAPASTLPRHFCWHQVRSLRAAPNCVFLGLNAELLVCGPVQGLWTRQFAPRCMLALTAVSSMLGPFLGLSRWQLALARLHLCSILFVVCVQGRHTLPPVRPRGRRTRGTGCRCECNAFRCARC
jgi:hypothetical protein